MLYITMKREDEKLIELEKQRQQREESYLQSAFEKITERHKELWNKRLKEVDMECEKKIIHLQV